jgi:hypothetical protein
MSDSRSVRYRRLAMRETDPVKAQLLSQLADEAERGVLCTVDRKSSQAMPPAPQSVIPEF